MWPGGTEKAVAVFLAAFVQKCSRTAANFHGQSLSFFGRLATVYCDTEECFFHECVSGLADFQDLSGLAISGLKNLKN
jgi:hypothetical protein